MSLMPSGYQISCTTNETQICFIGQNGPSSMKERKELLISKLEKKEKEIELNFYYFEASLIVRVLNGDFAISPSFGLQNC